MAAALVNRSSPTTWQGTLDDPAFHKPEFVLTDDTGHPYDFDQRTKGQLTLLYFGYTHCPDFCPITMDTLSGALADLPGQAGDRGVRDHRPEPRHPGRAAQVAGQLQRLASWA